MLATRLAPSIVLVEDDGPLRTLTARALREHGYEVRPAATGAEMWVLLDSAPADLVVLDIMLPGTNGIELFRKLRKLSDVPIIFISARGSEEDRVLGLELGADDYLAKPFGTRELVARVGAVLRRGGQGGDGPGTGQLSGGRGVLTAGTISSIDGDTITLKLADGSTVKVSTSGSTSVTKTSTAKVSDLAAGDTITVIGKADSSGNVTATRISEGDGGFGGFVGGARPSGAPTP